MALKGDRHVLKTDITFFMNEVAERGGMTVYSTGGSGAALDQSAALVTYTVISGSRSAGLLLTEMVNVDQTRQHINQHKDEVQKGNKVTLLTHGWVVTDRIVPGVTVSVGQPAYVRIGGTGMLTNVVDAGLINPTQVTEARVGRWLSSKDEDGYAKVEINLT